MNKSSVSLLCLFTGLTVALASAPATAVTLTVEGTANIFGAGKLSPPSPGGGGSGTLPPVYNFSAGSGKVLTFSNVTGLASCCGTPGLTGPDGGPFASGTTNILSFEGISGIINGDATMFLVGVFLTDAELTDPAPERLDFTGATDFTQLAPVIGQTFFIGDGLTGTGSGTVQQFIVPETATRLYLGFADALEFGDPVSLPGFYFDNVGELTAEFEISSTEPPEEVPEPTSVLGLMTFGALGASSVLKRKQQKA